jgi:tRNA dimethylallyltransferase
MSRPRLVCLVGPTASGKTALALELAERLGGEIVSADSRQAYRGLDIGTAKPTAAERRRVLHHGLDLIDPGERLDASRFRTVATEAIADLQRRGRVALVVGGTGLYVRALLGGLCAAPPREPTLRAALERAAADEGTAALHARLASVDPVAAARIHPHDGVRVVRALEVAFASGRPLSAWQEAHRFGDKPYDALIIGLARPVAELDARIAARADAMLAAGFLDEVRALARRGLEVDAPGLEAVGYRELRACVDGTCSLSEALGATILATRRFAKRQRTWFRAESGVVWHHPDDEREQIAADVRAFLGGEPAVRVARGPDAA